MSKPITFSPGDILTAEEINNYLLENSEVRQATFDASIRDLKKQVEAKIATVDNELKQAEIYLKGGKPTYDYENL